MHTLPSIPSAPPLTSGQPLRREFTTSNATAALAGFETILIVEDDLAVRTIARHMLRSFGYRVVEAASPSEALHILREPSTPIHALLTDVVMPGMSGMELARLASALRPDLQVILMSGYPHLAVADQDSDQQFAAFLQKPFTPTQLATTLRAALDATH